MKVLNAFSPTMLPEGGMVKFLNVTLAAARAILRGASPSGDTCPVCGAGGWGICDHADTTGLYGEFLIPVESAVGHEGTAEVFSALLGKAIPAARVQVTLAVGEEALLGSLNSRLPEGKVLSREEMEGLSIRWILVRRIS